MRPLVEALIIALDIYKWVVVLAAVFSWLYAFNVVNTRNRFVSQIGEVLYKATEPVLGRMRRFMPNLGGLDISPIALLLLIFIIQAYLQGYLLPIVP